MRVILFFDLPVKTKKDKRVYRLFRKYLIKSGYNMIQYSVYSKILNNYDSVKQHLVQVRKNVPTKGNIRVMIVTERQYANIEIIVGGKSFIEEVLTIDPLVEF